jgi:predicted nucleic acid-binding protein
MIAGLDTNILCYTLDKAYPENEILGGLLLNLSQESKLALNPTVLHETYHTLVFGQKCSSEEAAIRLDALLSHTFIDFFNQTKKTSHVALNLSIKHVLGGRDALIVTSYIVNKIPVSYTHDKELLKIQKIIWKNTDPIFKDPLTQI